MGEEYWEECIEASFLDAGISATAEQIQSVAADVAVSHEQYGMAFGHDCIPNPLSGENEALKKELKRERDKTICPNCKGRGTETTHGPCHSCTSSCFKCRGEGFIYY